MADSSQKTEQPTPRRLREARKKGKIPRSPDLIGAVGFCVFVIFSVLLLNNNILFLMSYLKYIILEIERHSFLLPETLFLKSAVLCARIVLPVLVIISGISLLFNFIQTKGVVSVHVLKPDMQRINPVEGFKKMFSKSKAFEVFKSVSRLLVILIVFSITLYNLLKEIMFSGAGGFLNGKVLFHGFISLTTKACLIFIIFGILDFIHQRIRNRRELMMSRQEVMRDIKEEEGDPLYRSERKKRHREIAMHLTIENVRRASVVVVNPVHIAAALRYETKEMDAPYLVAKGRDKIAARIKEIAINYGVPVMENIPLAHALEKLDPGEEIPEELYEAVAEILIKISEMEKEQLLKGGGDN